MIIQVISSEYASNHSMAVERNYIRKPYSESAVLSKNEKKNTNEKKGRKKRITSRRDEHQTNLIVSLLNTRRLER